MEGTKLILIIDDEPDFIETMRFFLESCNFHVVSASSPEEGLAKAALKPDLILVDLTMPGMSGHEVCKRIKESCETRHIPVVMLTSQSATLDKVEAFNLGVADYIGKTFPFEEILARIKSVLREHSKETSAESDAQRVKKVMDLRAAIDGKNMRTLFQPIVVLKDRQPLGYEALTRGPQGTFLENPVNLFTLASESNMSLELETLCLSLALQRARFLGKGQLLFLNIDPMIINAGYFKDSGFLKGASVETSQICIEITERTCVKNYGQLAASLAYCKSLGIKVSIDDVGEGYSSLNAVAELRPEFIKVDMGLVRNVDTDIVKSSLIQVIGELAKKLNSHLIAEGIETEGEYRALCSIGVEYGQGYLFARPCEAP